MSLIHQADSPLVSVIIPVYNGSIYMREAIDSALAQTYENTEVIVVNDGSSDGGATREIALSYGERIRYFEKENGGVSSALNLGISEMRGEYFSWLSHDDVYEPQKIERQIRLLEGKNHCVAYCGFKTINAASHVISNGKPDTVFVEGGVIPWQTALFHLFEGTSYGGCSFLIPRRAFEECGPFEESLRYVQDLLMWIRLFLNGYNVLYSPRADVLSRVHEKQQTQTARQLFKAESKVMHEMVLPELKRISTKQDNFLYAYARYNAKYHNVEVVKKCVNAAQSQKLFSLGQKIKLNCITAYGSVRPIIRAVYYKLFRGMNTDI